MEFLEAAKIAGITCLLVNHVTKDGKIAGPRALEHAVDCVLFLRRVFDLRPLFVIKNRFGPTPTDPVVLTLGDRGLTESEHAALEASTVLGYCGKGEEISEVQASVSIPSYGIRPGLNAAFLPVKRIQQLLKTMSTIEGIDVMDCSLDINCLIPAQHVYTPALDLPIIVALLGSYLHQPVDGHTLFVGEVDLAKKIRPPEEEYLSSLARILLGLPPDRITRVYLSEDVADELREKRVAPGGQKVGDVIEVRGVVNLDDLIIDLLWPLLSLPEEVREEVAHEQVQHPPAA